MRVISLCFIVFVGGCCAAYVDRRIVEYSIPKEVETERRKCAVIEDEVPKTTCPKFPRPIDCREVLANGHNMSGVYTIHPRSRVLGCDSIEVYCDMETDGGGWTVIQRRGDFGNGENFFVKNWQAYKKGFGSTKREFWLGNDNIHAITNQDSYAVRIDLQRMNGETAFAVYDTFYIEDEEQNYRLHILDYSGTASNALSPYHHLSLFYTTDKRNDPPGRKQEEGRHKGGWWLNRHPSTNLNGINRRRKDQAKDGIQWNGFGESGFVESLAATRMAVRPKKFDL